MNWEKLFVKYVHFASLHGRIVSNCVLHCTAAVWVFKMSRLVEPLASNLAMQSLVVSMFEGYKGINIL